MSIRAVIDQLKERGFDVYGPEQLTTYVWFTDGSNIGYVQYSGMRGTAYSTVHKPCRECGTGFQAENAQEALGFAPRWASAADIKAVHKYQDIEEFKKKYWQPLVQY